MLKAERFEPQYLSLSNGQLSDWARNELRRAGDDIGGMPPMLGGSGTFSNFFETAVLAHATGQDNAAWANLSPVFLALCTVVPDSSKTGTTITEASYTGYARLSIPNGSFAAPTAGGAGAASSIANNATLTFAPCTAGSSTIIGWALCTAATVGNVIAWGSASSTVISTTQTPATVATGALTITLI